MAALDFHFIEPGVKVNGTYYRDNFLAKKLLSDIFWISQGGILSFNRTVHWRIEHATPSLSMEPNFISPTLWPLNSPDLNPVDYSIWSVLQEKVHRSTIANVSELDMRLMNERGTHCGVDRGCCHRPVAPSSQRLCPWSGAHFEHQESSFSYFVMYLSTDIKLMEIRQSSDIIFHSFSLETVNLVLLCLTR